ncbi:MAG: hypothetical protein AB1478_06895 [Nitrospirota bacterium]
MKCKYCQNVIEDPQAGLRDFCNEDCKKAHRLAYKANWMRQNRNVHKEKSKNPVEEAIPQNVDKSNPTVKPVYKGKNQALGLSEDNFKGNGRKYEIFLLFRDREVKVEITPVRDSEYVFAKYAGIQQQYYKKVVELWLERGVIE